MPKIYLPSLLLMSHPTKSYCIWEYLFVSCVCIFSMVPSIYALTLLGFQKFKIYTDHGIIIIFIV